MIFNPLLLIKCPNRQVLGLAVILMGHIHPINPPPTSPFPHTTFALNDRKKLYTLELLSLHYVLFVIPAIYSIYYLLTEYFC